MSGRALIGWLEALKGGPSWTAARATLRRSLAFDPGTYPPAIPYVEPLVREEGWARHCHYLVAGLYALKDGVQQDGRTLARALSERGRHSPESSERRFLALLDADRDQIAFRLRQAVALVEGGLDFAQLLDDLVGWLNPSRPVQVRWAREFYSAVQTREDGAEVET